MMDGFKFYSWTVSMDDGSRLSYEFEVHDADPWTTVLRKYGNFLESEGYKGVSARIEDVCADFENQLDQRLDGIEAFNSYHTESAN